MSVARFIADQRTFYRVPHAFSCRVLAMSDSWFYKWIKAPTTVRGRRRALLDEAVRAAFTASHASYGSPRVHEDLIDPEVPHPELEDNPDTVVVELPVHRCSQAPVSDRSDTDASMVETPDALQATASGGAGSGGAVWRVSVNTVADSMRRQGLKGRKVKRNRGLTRQDRSAPKFPDLLKRDFTAPAPCQRGG